MLVSVGAVLHDDSVFQDPGEKTKDVFSACSGRWNVQIGDGSTSGFSESYTSSVQRLFSPRDDKMIHRFPTRPKFPEMLGIRYETAS